MAKGGPSGINVHDWEVCHRESRITVSSGCPDIFDQIVYLRKECAVFIRTRLKGIFDSKYFISSAFKDASKKHSNSSFEIRVMFTLENPWA
jgi:hypothetical protein